MPEKYSGFDILKLLFFAILVSTRKNGMQLITQLSETDDNKRSNWATGIKIQT